MAAAPSLAASPFDQQSSSEPAAAAPSSGQQAEGLLVQAASQPQLSGLPLPEWHNEVVLIGHCSLPGDR